MLHPVCRAAFGASACWRALINELSAKRLRLQTGPCKTKFSEVWSSLVRQVRDEAEAHSDAQLGSWSPQDPVQACGCKKPWPRHDPFPARRSFRVGSTTRGPAQPWSKDIAPLDTAEPSAPCRHRKHGACLESDSRSRHSGVLPAATMAFWAISLYRYDKKKGFHTRSCMSPPATAHHDLRLFHPPKTSTAP